MQCLAGSPTHRGGKFNFAAGSETECYRLAKEKRGKKEGAWIKESCCVWLGGHILFIFQPTTRNVIPLDCVSSALNCSVCLSKENTLYLNNYSQRLGFMVSTLTFHPQSAFVSTVQDNGLQNRTDKCPPVTVFSSISVLKKGKSLLLSVGGSIHPMHCVFY